MGDCLKYQGSAVDSGVPEQPPEFGGSEKGRSLISVYQSLAITMNTPGFEKVSTALQGSSTDYVLLASLHSGNFNGFQEIVL